MPAKKNQSHDSNSKLSSPIKTRKAKTVAAKTSRRTSKTDMYPEIATHSSSHAMFGESNLTDRIAKRAYELHQQRGYQHGYDFEDWLQAEREILSLNHP